MNQKADPTLDQVRPRPVPRGLIAGICVLLALVVCLVFGQTSQYGFVNYDDGDYVYENPVILKGLTLGGIKWAFTHSHGANWHPVTGISHMLDCQFFHEEAGWHHITNITLHAATAVLLFLVLYQLTHALWPAAFVAAVFAIHPLRVESVAWISERKDVLSGLFFMLTLCAYIRYARKPGAWTRYLAVVIFYALGLMSKPTLVTLPFLLLLLDYWPLGRWSSAVPVAAGSTPPPRFIGPLPVRLVIEKIPLFILSAACCLATVLAQKGAIEPVEVISFPARIANALVSYIVYICQMFYPARLAVLYPLPGNGVPLGRVILAALALAAISMAACLSQKKRPWLLVGWLWYLGMLVPVIGLVQVGAQAHADRYTYLPQIGLYMMIAWGFVDLCASLRFPRAVPSTAASVAVLALGICAWKQTRYWRDSGALWLRDLACTQGNPIAHCNYGYYLFGNGRTDEAVAHYKEALKLWPGYLDAQCDYAIAIAEKNPDEALVHYKMALAIKPDFPEVQNNIAGIYYQRGEYAGAVEYLRKALQSKPGYGPAHYSLALNLSMMGNVREAIYHYEQALAVDPRDTRSLCNLSWILSASRDPSLRNGTRAVGLAQQANQLSGGKNPSVLRTLAAAYAGAGQFGDALAAAQKALDLVDQQSQKDITAALRREMELYRAGIPLFKAAGN